MTACLTIAGPAHMICPDEAYGVIRMRVEGFFDLPHLERHFAQSDRIVSDWRSAGRPIRVLIDAVDLKPHSPEGQAYVQQSTARIYRPGDKVAVRVASSLVKMQMRRALAQGGVIDFFLSENAALTWLTAGRTA